MITLIARKLPRKKQNWKHVHSQVSMGKNCEKLMDLLELKEIVKG